MGIEGLENGVRFRVGDERSLKCRRKSTQKSRVLGVGARIYARVKGPGRGGKNWRVPQVQTKVCANFVKFKRQCFRVVSSFLFQSCYTLLSLQILSIQSCPLGQFSNESVHHEVGGWRMLLERCKKSLISNHSTMRERVLFNPCNLFARIWT
jgi:hypothetical protein